VLTARTGAEALERALGEEIDLVVLDIILPEVDGLEVCRRLRTKTDVPILMLSAKTDEVDKVVGLELGADDYLTKPFSPRELVARVRALLRRADTVGVGPAPPAVLEFPGLVVDAESRTVTVAGEDVHLTRKEFDLLFCLASQPKRVFSRAEILAEVWRDDSSDSDLRTVDTHVKRLRRKLTGGETQHWRLETVWGVGYKFDTANAS
jgi:DNA-binding response OmpR family regulator